MSVNIKLIQDIIGRKLHHNDIVIFSVKYGDHRVAVDKILWKDLRCGSVSTFLRQYDGRDPLIIIGCCGITTTIDWDLNMKYFYKDLRNIPA